MNLDGEEEPTQKIRAQREENREKRRGWQLHDQVQQQLYGS